MTFTRSHKSDYVVSFSLNIPCFTLFLVSNRLSQCKGATKVIWLWHVGWGFIGRCSLIALVKAPVSWLMIHSFMVVVGVGRQRLSVAHRALVLAFQESCIGKK